MSAETPSPRILIHTPPVPAPRRTIMTELRRRGAIRLLGFGLLLLILPGTSRAQQLPPIAQQMAKTHGLDSFGQIEGIRYSFNAELPNVTLSRSWEWNPKTDTVSYEGKDKEGKPVKATYQRSQIDSQSDAIKNVIDPAFVNDQYWLLFPLHVAWDTSATVTDEGMQKLPLGNGSAERVVVKYPSEGGYAPGDTWDLYVGADKRIEEFVYHRGTDKKPNIVIANWTEYKKAGPLLISADHHGTADDKPLHISFSDVSVKVTGSETWIKAQ
jgi:hypothetical protein